VQKTGSRQLLHGIKAHPNWPVMLMYLATHYHGLHLDVQNAVVRHDTTVERRLVVRICINRAVVTNPTFRQPGFILPCYIQFLLNLTLFYKPTKLSNCWQVIYCVVYTMPAVTQCEYCNECKVISRQHNIFNWIMEIINCYKFV